MKCEISLAQFYILLSGLLTFVGFALGTWMMVEGIQKNNPVPGVSPFLLMAIFFTLGFVSLVFLLGVFLPYCRGYEKVNERKTTFCEDLWFD